MGVGRKRSCAQLDLPSPLRSSQRWEGWMIPSMITDRVPSLNYTFLDVWTQLSRVPQYEKCRLSIVHF